MTRFVHFRTMLVLLLSLGCGLARAEVIALNPSVEDEYVVKRGDTLWDIAAYYLQEPWQWPQVWQVNPQIANPHLIYPGDVLVLSFVDGRPVLGFRKDSIDRRMGPEVRRSDLDDAIPPIPLGAIIAFLNGPRVFDSNVWEDAPYVLAFDDDRLLGSIGMPVYARRLEDKADRLWQVFHRGQTILDPESGNTMGYEGIPVGALEVREFGDPAEGELTEVLREVLRGDRLFTEGAPPLPGSFMPAPPPKPVEGRVAAIYDQYTQAGQYQIVAINRGSDHGLAAGHVLEVQRKGKMVTDPTKSMFREVKLPPLSIGYMMLFDVGERLSYALILQASRGVQVGDRANEPRP